MVNVEQLQTKQEFEQNKYHEVEKKYIPLFPESLAEIRTQSRPIEQYYLSHPKEAFSLRFREEVMPDGQIEYTATLKDRGHLSDQGINRVEVTAKITKELYDQYLTAQTPIIRKLRAEPLNGVVVDFYSDHTQLEAEDSQAWEHFINLHGDNFVEITGDQSSSNEWQAHLSYRRLNGGKETLVPQDKIDVKKLIGDILQNKKPNQPLCVHIGGRTGSGKSTLVNEIIEQLNQLGLSHTTLSTDDYHRGNTWLTQLNKGLPWEHWDEPIVYDTATMARDLNKLRAGKDIYKRQMNWVSVEPIVTGALTSNDVILVEGIYALAPEITQPDDLAVEMTTPIATCIGRRILRDMNERPDMADPSYNLLYLLTDAEPAYKSQER